MQWAIAQGHSDMAELLVLRDLDLLLRENTAPGLKPLTAIARGKILEAQEILSTSEDEVGHREALTPRIIHALTTAAVEELDYNALSVLLAVEHLLSQAPFFERQRAYVQALLMRVMDGCKTREQARAVLAPLPGDAKTFPQPPIEHALRTDNKGLIAHRHVSGGGDCAHVSSTTEKRAVPDPLAWKPDQTTLAAVAEAVRSGVGRC